MFFNYIENCMQTDVDVNPAASHGLLLNAPWRAFRLIDTIFAKLVDSDAGVNFAMFAKPKDRFFAIGRPRACFYSLKYLLACDLRLTIKVI